MVALSDPPRPLACPGCAALPAAQVQPVAQEDDILLSLPDIHCVNCIRDAENALLARPDVAQARVNLTLRRAYVTPAGQVTPEALAETLQAAGIAAQPLDRGQLNTTARQAEGRALLLRLAVAGFAMMNIMLLSVAVWSGAGDATRDLFHWISAAIALPAVAYCGQPFWRGAWQGLRVGRLNMDVPIALALLLALATSLWETMLSGHHAYFDAAIALCFFLLIGRYLDHRARAAARSAAEELTALDVPRVLRMTPDGPREVAQAEIAVGDAVCVRPGGRIPVDGVVTEGQSELDRSLLTGETLPVPVGPDARVSAGEINLSGPLILRATAIGKDTSLHRLADLVAVAEAGRSRYTPLADRAAALYAPGVHILSALAFLGWLFWAGDLRVALNIAAAVLIITCPCALGLAVPAVTTAASGRFFRLGLLVKNATALERLAEVDTVVFDKTGTLTTGRPRLANWDTVDGQAQAVAQALAAVSDHPLARAIHAASPARGNSVKVTDITEYPGFGIEGIYQGHRVRLGRPGWAGPANTAVRQAGPVTWLDPGDGAPVRIRFEDDMRTGAGRAVAGFAAMGCKIHLLSGDEPGPVSRVADDLAIAHVRSKCTPRGKADYLQHLSDAGAKVLMVGDGLNDTVALAGAHVSISLASALDAARAASDIVLLHDTLEHLPETLALARVARRRIAGNFRIATWYNVIAVPLAVAGLATPLIAALAMSASSVTVSLNALRLRAR